jgi:hypothetical protein
MEKVGIFYVHCQYTKAIWYVLWSFGNFVVIWYLFPPFWYIVSKKSGNPGRRRSKLPRIR